LGLRPAAYAALAGLFFAADIGLWGTGVVLRGATIPTLLVNTAPIWVGLGALVFYRQRLGVGFWMGLLLAFLGAGWVLGADLRLAGVAGRGSLLGLAAGLFYAGYFLIMQRARREADPLASFWVAAAASAIALLCAAWGLGLPLTGYAPRTYLSFLGLALVTQVLGYLSITYALGHAPASLVAPVMLGQPLMTALLAWPLLGEALSPGQILGGGAVLLGVYGVQREHARRLD
jgi:drug/metabolite transporter (DMT)-like permease